MNKSFLRLLLAAVTLFTVLFPVWAQSTQSERILNFTSDITVKKDASMIVTETIMVQAAGINIKHGIYRDFPTRYKDRLGNRIVVGFDILDIMLDGSPSPYHTKDMSNGVRVYIGDPDSYVSAGEHSYTLRYKTWRQLGFFEDHDELYWNVTGNGWMFSIDHASANVTLPAGITRDKIQVEGYTGPQGSKAQNYRASVDSSGQAHIETTRGLWPEEGLTLVVSFPKGFVIEPSTATKVGYLVKDNKILLEGIICLLLVLGYFLFAWWNYGRDLPEGTIIPRFMPPEGYSPAALRYVRRMGYDNKTFAAAMISLAVKGYLTITESKEGLFSGKSYTVKKIREVEQNPRSVIEAELRRGVATRYSILAGQAGVPVDTVKSIIGTMSSEGLPIESSDEMVRMYAPSASSTAGSTPDNSISSEELALLANLLPLPNDSIALKNDNYQDIQQAIAVFTKALKASYENRFFITNMALYVPGILISGALIFLLAVINGFSLPLIITAILIIFLDALFYYLMKAPTPSGRKLMDEIEGFRMYLDTAEKDELNFSNPPEKTPELFEKYLPYALALDVEQRWSEKFAGVLARAAAGGESYHPVWYYGNSWSTLGAAGFASSLSSSLSSAISSSATAPGSSSGSGGGGSSGGGGGGGGGGGW